MERIIIAQNRQATRTGSVPREKDIHAQLQRTIEERKKILKEWDETFLQQKAPRKKDVHAQLKDTIAEYKMIKKRWSRFFSVQNDRKDSGSCKNAA